MKRTTLAFLALAAALAITPVAMADTCSFVVMSTSGTESCVAGGFTFTFMPTTITAIAGGRGTDSLTLTSSTTNASRVVLNFTVGGSQADDFDLDYSVTGPAGKYGVDNYLGGEGTITELVCAEDPNGDDGGGTKLTALNNSSGGLTEHSALFS